MRENRQGAGRARPHPKTSTGDEQARLRELHSLRLFGTEREERLDRITQLVADVLGASICLITLVGEKRQWIKAATGMSRGYRARGDSFCAYALHQKEVLVVDDTLADSVFAGNTLVTEPPYVRFYAGAVIRGPTGQPLGTLCILDPKPRKLSRRKQRHLCQFVNIVEQDLSVSAQLQRTREELRDSALHDSVTGLPRASLLEERLAGLVESARAEHDHAALAVVSFLEYDQFLGTYGQEAVDKAVKMFAERLQEQAGRSGLVGRLARDRMLVAARHIVGEAELEGWSQRVYHALTEPYAVGTGQRRAPVALGVAGFPRDARTASELLARAIVAKVNRPHLGPRLYEASRDHRMRYRDLLHCRLTEALEQDRLTLAFQPVFHADGRRPVSCEALARWEDAELGQVSPGEFIPLAESDPQLRRMLTSWVLRTACEAARRWNTRRSETVPVSVNVAGAELHDPSLIVEVQDALSLSGLAPELLMLEITERTLVTDFEAASRVVYRLAEQGVRCALDDFGIGYSSLSYLRSIPLHSLKMDRSFVAEVASDSVARELARGIVSIARALGMHVVAEGVETEEQRTHLEAIGCNYLQGFLLGRPQSFQQFYGLLRS